MKVSLKKALPVQLVVGTQWGDEGKGKVVDLLAEDVDIVARYQGGPNAGHTVKIENETFIFHHIPTGVLRPNIQCIIGNGLVIDPISMLDEIRTLEKRGIDVVSRLFISPWAHLILPYHSKIEKLYEELKKGKKIGTTGRGIGPAYADKMSRIGIRVGDLLDRNSLREKISETVGIKNQILQKVFGVDGFDPAEIEDILIRFLEKIKNCITDTTLMLNSSIREGKNILLEGAQGTLLDIDFGTYPFVTSSNTTCGGVCTGLGISLRRVDRIIGILKAYTTRVGNGPFPTEVSDSIGTRIRELGGEYGATTGRPRRCGWFDGVIAKYAVMINDIDVLVITKLDVLDSLDQIKICTKYRHKGVELDSFTPDSLILREVEPVYETFPGWGKKISDIRTYSELPDAARIYLKRIEQIAGVPIGVVSVGSHRDEIIWVE